MTDQFFGRQKEIQKLTDFITSDNENAALIYGRRRVGKTALLKHCLENSPQSSVYYECKETSEYNNTACFSEILSDILNLPPLSFASFEAALTFLFKYASDKKITLVIDEYPYIRKALKGADSIIQNLLDTFRGKSGLKLILCGSYVDTMKSLLLEENPLFGRFDLVFNLKAMNYYESSLFYRQFSNEDKVRLYSVFGGIPYYNKLINPEKSVKQNIIDLIAAPDSRLENEIQMYLKSEISKMTNAYEVFEALAKGYTRFSDLLSQSKISSSPALADILEKIIKMDIVIKQAPINDENNRKKTGYYVSDQLTLFYFKYIYKNLSRQAVMNTDSFYDRFIAPDFEQNYVPKAFEQICSQYLIMKNQSGELENPFERIGKYYYDDPVNHKNGEFDIVSENNGTYIFYEVKFRDEKLDKSRIYQEIQQVNASGLTCAKYGFFSKSDFKPIDKELRKQLILFTLNDLYNP